VASAFKQSDPLEIAEVNNRFVTSSGVEYSLPLQAPENDYDPYYLGDDDFDDEDEVSRTLEEELGDLHEQLASRMLNGNGGTAIAREDGDYFPYVHIRAKPSASLEGDEEAPNSDEEAVSADFSPAGIKVDQTLSNTHHSLETIDKIVSVLVAIGRKYQYDLDSCDCTPDELRSTHWRHYVWGERLKCIKSQHWGVRMAISDMPYAYYNPGRILASSDLWQPPFAAVRWCKKRRGISYRIHQYVLCFRELMNYVGPGAFLNICVHWDSVRVRDDNYAGFGTRVVVFSLRLRHVSYG
jgi:hypothetical protein